MHVTFINPQGNLDPSDSLASGYPAVDRLPIPAYFTDPSPESDIALETLDDLYYSPDDAVEQKV